VAVVLPICLLMAAVCLVSYRVPCYFRMLARVPGQVDQASGLHDAVKENRSMAMIQSCCPAARQKYFRSLHTPLEMTKRTDAAPLCMASDKSNQTAGLSGI